MTETQNTPDSITSNAQIADALDNLEGLATELRTYLNGSGAVLDHLSQITWFESNLNDLRQGLVDQARFNGHTWAEVGAALGTTRQAAYQRFGRDDGSTRTSAAGYTVEIISVPRSS